MKEITLGFKYDCCGGFYAETILAREMKKALLKKESKSHFCRKCSKRFGFSSYKVIKDFLKGLEVKAAY